MIIKQFFDTPLAHSSYAVISDNKMALIDPARDTTPYEKFAMENDSDIVMVLETHPHADFVSSHKELHEKFGAPVYINPKAGVSYPHQPLEHGDEVTLGQVTFRALFTPGHSPDHNSYLLLDEKGKEKAVFTGDSLFVGDVGRPDLREGAGNIQASRHDLAEMMFDSIRNIFTDLQDDTLVYPAHGAGSLCGKNMSQDRFSTIGREKKENWAFQLQDKKKFIESFLEGQPFIPKYFPYDVELNRHGADALTTAVSGVKRLTRRAQLEKNVLIIDTRPANQFKAGHYPGAINIIGEEEEKFETWLGAIVAPNESFYLVSENAEKLARILLRVAKIGYESQVTGALVYDGEGEEKTDSLDKENFSKHPEEYTIVDIRNESETANGKIFRHAISIPLHSLRTRINEVPEDKPVVVHCAGGYRSATGSSILQARKQVPVFDLSDFVKEFQENVT
jgi:glyoxylase-like metal-dependent hydrolase (beta-lactamase superfamily II)/rhodanese-related sulfurtransferase